MHYILLKDLPGVKAGAIFTYNNSSHKYYLDGNIQGCNWTAEHIQNSPEWFERVVVEKVKYTDAELISFGNYLLSDKRKECFHAGSYTELMERLNHVHDCDLTNWQDKINNMDVE